MQETPQDLYLTLLRSVLTRSLGGAVLDGGDPDKRRVGLDWPTEAETMMGEVRLQHLEWCVRQVIADSVPGDLLETGVWRGGGTILMRAVLAAFGCADRTVWVADSFRGLPVPDLVNYPADAGGEDLSGFSELAISRSEVEENFRKYGLLDDQVRFLEGWFKDTMPVAPIEQLAVLRLDGDYYESTIQVLETMEPRLAVGGFCIIDDYGWGKACAQAVSDYRGRHNIIEEICTIDWTGVYWRKAR